MRNIGNGVQVQDMENKQIRLTVPAYVRLMKKIIKQDQSTD